MLGSLASQDFEPYLNATFTLSTDQQSFEAELVEVKTHNQPRDDRRMVYTAVLN